MPLTILTDNDVRAVLDSLDKQDILDLHSSLADALHTYSTSTEDIGCSASNQPHRISIKRKDGGVTLFMPATSNDAYGVKIVTIQESDSSDLSSISHRSASLSLNTTLSNTTSSRSSSPKSTPRSGTPVSSTGPSRASTFSSQTNSSQAPSSSSPDTAKSDMTAGGVPIFHPNAEVPLQPPSSTSPHGSITLLSDTGEPRALINASVLTAFRTALASTMLLKGRHSAHTLTVFGAGMQAYWHIHLALLLRGHDIHHLNVINRNFPRAQRLMINIARHPMVGIPDKMRPSILTPEYTEYDRLLKEHVRNADVIFCCTPATDPLFPAGHLTNPEGRKKARYVAAIGSYKPHMRELHEDVLRKAVAPPHGKHHHRHAAEGGAIVVDTIEGAMKEAGEIIAAGISGNGVVELGELVMLKRSHWAEKAERERDAQTRGDNEGKTQTGGHGLGHLFHRGQEHVDEGDGGLRHWLQKGNVIYKSVGIGLMDVVVGMEIVRLAEQRGIGTTVKDF